MGLDLTLLPFDDETPGNTYSHTILDVHRRHSLFDAILESDIILTPVPVDFTSYLGTVPDGAHEGESGYGVTVSTPYGESLKACTANDLIQFAQHEGVLNNHKNRAVWAYLAAIEPNTKVALYWS